MRQFFNFLVHSNIFIALCSSLLFIYYGIKLQQNFFISTVFFVFAGTYISYHIVRIAPWLRGRQIESFFPTWYKKNKFYSIISLISALAMAIYTIFDLALIQVSTIIVSFIIVLLYETVLTSFIELRKVPYGKPLFISLSWTLVCVGLHYKGLNKQIVLNSIDCFSLIFLLCLPFDMKDKEIDKSQGIRSIPNLISIKVLVPTMIIIFTLYLIVSNVYLSPQASGLSSALSFLIFSGVQVSFLLKRNITPLALYLCIDGIIIIKTSFLF
jgi:hypothetical protein